MFVIIIFSFFIDIFLLIFYHIFYIHFKSVVKSPDFFLDFYVTADCTTRITITVTVLSMYHSDYRYPTYRNHLEILKLLMTVHWRFWLLFLLSYCLVLSVKAKNAADGFIHPDLLHFLSYKFTPVSLYKDKQYDQRKDIRYINSCPFRETDPFSFICFLTEVFPSPSVTCCTE